MRLERIWRPILLLGALILLLAFNCSAADKEMIYAHVNENVLTILPSENSSAEDFLELLRDGNVTVEMHDYGSFEKVGPLGTS